MEHATATHVSLCGGHSIAHIIVCCVCVCGLALQCSIDSRKELAENIVVIGGVVGMQGFM